MKEGVGGGGEGGGGGRGGGEVKRRRRSKRRKKRKRRRRGVLLLTLGAHAPEGYGSCPVCVSVRNLNLGTGASRGLNEGTSE